MKFTLDFVLTILKQYYKNNFNNITILNLDFSLCEIEDEQSNGINNNNTGEVISPFPFLILVGLYIKV